MLILILADEEPDCKTLGQNSAEQPYKAVTRTCPT